MFRNRWITNFKAIWKCVINEYDIKNVFAFKKYSIYGWPALESHIQD